MGAIGGLLGTAGGQSGTGVSGPSAAPIQNPVNQGQVDQSQAGVGDALGTQSILRNTLLMNNGTGNQNQTYAQGQGALGTLNALNGAKTMGGATSAQGALSGQLAGAGGVGFQTGAGTGLQSVIGQQQAIANGQGPNPAQAMLNQATGQNVANQAALMAGQRGAGANVGLLARQAAQVGAGAQQQAVGQAASMQAQQQLGALNAMTGANQALAGVGAGLTGQQQNAIAGQYGMGQGAVQLGQAQQGINAGIAQNQVQNVLGATNQSVQGNLQNASQNLGAMGQFNSTAAGQQENINSANAGLANTNMQGQQGLIGGLLNAAGGGSKTAGGARGGMVQNLADGGPVAPAVAAPAAAPVAAPQGPQSSFGQFLSGMGQSPFQTGQGLNPGAKALQSGVSSILSGPVKSGIKSMFADTPAADIAGPDAVDAAGNAAMVAARGGLARGGGKVNAAKPSQKAVKAGNSYDNDKIPAMLSQGEIVLPRSVTMSSDPVRSAADFVAKVMARRKK